MKKIKLSLQDKYELSKTKVSHYVIDKDGNVKRDTMGRPVRKINSYLTADIKKEANEKTKEKS